MRRSKDSSWGIFSASFPSREFLIEDLSSPAIPMLYTRKKEEKCTLIRFTLHFATAAALVISLISGSGEDAFASHGFSLLLLGNFSLEITTKWGGGASGS